MANTESKKTNQNFSIPCDWEVAFLESICIKKGLVRGPFGGALKKEYFDNVGYKVYEQKNAIYRNADLGEYFINEKLFQELKRFEVKPKDFIISCSGTIGRIFQIPENAKKGIINQALLIIKTDDSVIDDKYFFQFFDWDKFQSKIIDNTQGGAMQNLVGMDIFRKSKISLPPLPEQKAIAHILGLMDSAINANNRLITQNELRKKWLMQNLLTGKNRLRGFEGEWNKLGAGEVFKSISVKGFENEELLSATQDKGIIPRSTLEARVTMPSGETTSFKLVEAGDFVISLRSFQGGLEYSYFRGIVSPAYTVLKPRKQINDEFYKQYFKSYDFIGHLATAVIGIRDGKQISYDDFCVVKIPYPSIKEQTTIAQVLQAVDKEIQLLKTKTEKLKEQKKGMMQVLLTGRKRLKIIN